MAFRAIRKFFRSLIDDEEERQAEPTDPELWRRLAEKQELIEYMTARTEHLLDENARLKAFIEIARESLDNAMGDGEIVEEPDEEDEDGPSG